MRIFKFGGASVKDAKGVKNVLNVLKHEGTENTLVVISAMGKMTNAFENIVNAYCFEKDELSTRIQYVFDFHKSIIEALFESDTRELMADVQAVFLEMDSFLVQEHTDYNYIYDQVVGFGELLSTRIVSAYLGSQGLENTWIDVRSFIKTDEAYRDAHVDWTKTAARICDLESSKLYITQGFLGQSNYGNTTTLGREGSDYSAAIFAYCLNANSVTIWKDVDGVLNADPRYFENAELLDRISYREAIEMAFYGASVIHPKTLKPLENKNIPLHVRSFYNLNTTGTIVGKGSKLAPEIPCYILKKNQILVSISALDFSFMVEHNISDIFKVLHTHKLKVNLIQNSALSFSVCIEDKYTSFEQFLKEIKTHYALEYTKGVNLYTIRHANSSAVQEIEKLGEVLLKQATKETVQLIVQ